MLKTCLLAVICLTIFLESSIILLNHYRLYCSQKLNISCSTALIDISLRSRSNLLIAINDSGLVFESFMSNHSSRQSQIFALLKGNSKSRVTEFTRYFRFHATKDWETNGT